MHREMTYRMDDGALMAIVVVCRMSYVVCRMSSYVVVVVCRARRRVNGIALGLDGVRATNVSSNASGHHHHDDWLGWC
jgi:hypothetical protein